MTYTHLILGGARSGKSGFAEKLVNTHAKQNNKEKIYIATASAGDEEMATRIQQHKQQRDTDWIVMEEPLHLHNMLLQATSQQILLIDCLTLWLSNCLHQKNWDVFKQNFLQSLENCPADVVMVSNEVGNGIVPLGKLSRQFVDESGWLHQDLAQQCKYVSQVIAGLPVTLK